MGGVRDPGRGAESSVRSFDPHILVYEATEPISSQRQESLRRAGECGRRAGADQVIGAGGAVVALDVLPQDRPQGGALR